VSHDKFSNPDRKTTLLKRRVTTTLNEFPVWGGTNLALLESNHYCNARSEGAW